MMERLQNPVFNEGGRLFTAASRSGISASSRRILYSSIEQDSLDGLVQRAPCQLPNQNQTSIQASAGVRPLSNKAAKPSLPSHANPSQTSLRLAGCQGPK